MMEIIRKPMRYSHTEGHTDVCYSDDGKYIITCGTDGDVRVWCGLEDDDPSSHCVGEKAFAVAFKDKKLFVATDNNNVQAYTFPDLEKDGVISHFTAPVTHISITKSGNKIISGSCDMTIQIHDTITCNFESLSGHTAPVLGISVDPEMQYMASSSCDGTIRVWSLDTLKCVKIWSCIPVCNSFYLIKCLGKTSWQSPSGKYIAIPDEMSIDLYEKHTWEKIKSFSDSQIQKPFSIAHFSPCGQYIAGSTLCGEICIWEVSNSKTLSYTQHHRGYSICSMAWNPSNDGTIAFCDVSGQLGTVEGCISSEKEKESSVSVNTDFHLADLDDDVDDDDDENVISLEKIKSSVSQPANDLLGLDVNDDTITKDDDDDDDDGSKVSVQTSMKLQPPFQPSSSPVHLQHRYMVWNSVGIVRCFNTEEENSIDVEFHDATLHHALHMNNFMKHSLASLSEKALVLACEADGDSPSKIVCVLLNSWDGSREWSINLLEGEEVLAITCTNNWLAAATDVRNLRLFTISGTQRELISLPGPVVCLTSLNNMLFIAYHHGSGLNFVLFFVGRNSIRTMVQFQPLPVTPNSTLQWAGFTDEQSPCIMDSAGILRIFSAEGYWLPMCDTRAMCKGKSDNYFILGISEKYENIRCILCKGSHYPPTTPKPTVVEIPLKIPLCESDNERSKLEETFWRKTTLTYTLNRENDADLNLEKEEAENTIKRTIVQLFALACKSDLDQRALDICNMMPSVEVVELARKYASKAGKIQLVKRIDEIVLQNMSNDSFLLAENNPRYMLNKSISSLCDMEVRSNHDADNVDPFASSQSQSQESSSDKENMLMAIKLKMSGAVNPSPSVCQKRVNPFKKTPKQNSFSLCVDSIENVKVNVGEKVENGVNSLQTSTSNLSKVKQTGLWGKTPNPPASGKITFVQWFSKEKESLQEEFPNEDASSLTRMAMKRFKETVLKKPQSAVESNEGPQNSQEETGNSKFTEENHTSQESEERAETKKRKFDGNNGNESSTSSKLAKFLFKK